MNDNTLSQESQKLLTVAEKKRYFYSAQYFLEGASKKLLKNVQSEQNKILDKFKIVPNLSKNNEQRNKYLFLCGVLAGGLWATYYGLKKVVDDFDYDVVKKIQDTITEKRKEINKSLGFTVAQVDVATHLKGGVDSTRKFLRNIVDYVGLSFDYKPSYDKFGNKLTDVFQRNNGVFGDLVRVAFQTVLWFIMHRALPDIIMKFWRVPRPVRLDIDRGIVDVLWDDNTGYFHDVGDPYRRRLNSVTSTNMGINLTQEFAQYNNKPIEEIVQFDEGWLKSMWYTNSLKSFDVSSYDKTHEDLQILIKQVSKELDFLKTEVENGTFGVIQDKRQRFDFSVKYTARKQAKRQASTFPIQGKTFTKEMPHTKVKKGYWTEEAGKFKKLNTLLDTADRILHLYAYGNEDPHVKDFVKDILNWWAGYGIESRSPATASHPNGVPHHYNLQSAFEIVANMPRIAMFEIYAAKASLDGAIDLLYNYFTENEYQKKVMSFQNQLIEHTQRVDAELDQYKRGFITVEQYFEKKMEEIKGKLKFVPNEITMETPLDKMFSRLKQSCNLMIPTLLQIANLNPTITQLKQNYEAKIALMFGKKTTFFSNTGFQFKYDRTKRFQELTDSLTQIDGKQMDYKFDSESKNEDIYNDTKINGKIYGNTSTSQQDQICVAVNSQPIITGKEGERNKKNQQFIKENKSKYSIGDVFVSNNKKYRIVGHKVDTEIIPIGRFSDSEEVKFYIIGYEIVKIGEKKKVQVRTMKEDGSVWLDDYYVYDFYSNDLENIFEIVENTSRKDTSTISNFFSDKLSNTLQTNGMSASSINMISILQFVSMEDMIAAEREKRKMLIEKLFSFVDKDKDGSPIYLFTNTLINKIHGGRNGST